MPSRQCTQLAQIHNTYAAPITSNLESKWTEKGMHGTPPFPSTSNSEHRGNMTERDPQVVHNGSLRLVSSDVFMWWKVVFREICEWLIERFGIHKGQWRQKNAPLNSHTYIHIFLCSKCKQKYPQSMHGIKNKHWIRKFPIFGISIR